LKIERELRAQEIQTLEKRSRQINKRRSRLTKFVLVWTTTCFVAGAIIAIFMNPNLWLLLAVTVFIFAGIGLWTFLQEQGRGQKELKQIEYLRTANRVTSIKVQTKEFYELTEEEDEGAYYLFQIAPDKILSFGGQDFYSNKKFPSSDFEIVEGKGEGGQTILLETYSHGDKIKPLKKIKGKEKWDLLKKIKPDEFEIIDGRLEQFA
jgi:hypothetical protein